MSKANRKSMYDFLILHNRSHHITQNLIDEFGDPNPPVKEKKIKKKVKKNGR